MTHHRYEINKSTPDLHYAHVSYGPLLIALRCAADNKELVHHDWLNGVKLGLVYSKSHA